MLILSIIPYVNGWCGAVVADCSDTGRRVIGAASIETTALVDAVQGSRFNKRREPRDDITGRLQFEIRSMVAAHPPDRILLEVPPAKYELRATLALAILECLSGHAVEQVSSLWRTQAGDYATMRRENARSMVAASYVQNTVSQLTYDSTLMAAALISYTLDGIPDGLVKSERKPREIELPRVEAPAPIYDWRQLPSKEEECADSDSDIDVTAHAGIDPGSRKIAVAIGDAGSYPVTLRYLHTFDVGEIVQLDKPKVVELAGGASYTINHKRVLTSVNVRSLAIEVVEELKKHNVARLTIEHVEDVHVPQDSPSAASGMATHLVRTMWVATEIAVRAELAGIEVLRVTNSAWRAKVAATADGETKDDRIVSAINSGYRNWPSSTNEHERDAGGVLLFGELPEQKTQLVKRNQKAALSPGRKKAPMASLSEDAKEARRARNKEASDRRKEERQAARKAAGCSCKGRHVGSCPLAKQSAKALAYLEANR